MKNVIIRKPYAILIKNFKLIHTILLAFMAYLSYRFGIISKFFADYFADGENIIGQEITDDLFSGIMNFSVFIIIVGLIIVLVLMIMKKKPVKYYIGGIITYIAVFVIMIVTKNTINEMELELLSARTVRAISDINNIVLAIQILMIILTFVRATGFNIKQFDFEKDLQELNVTEEDREEVEVGLELDSGKFERKVRRQLRHIKYVYLENKLICNILIVIVVIFLGYNVYTKSGLNEKLYKQKEAFTTSNFIMSIEESYVTDTDDDNNKLKQGKTLVILKLKIRNLYTIPIKFQTAKTVLEIKDKFYYPTRDYLQDMRDLGQVYDNQKIGSEDSYYILCYEIPSNYLNKKMKFQYIDDVSGIENKLVMTSQKVRIDPIDLRDKKNVKNYKLKDVLEISNNILSGLSLKINSITIQDEYKLSYNFCIESGSCSQSFEYIKPDILNNYDKALMRLNLNYKLDNDYIINAYKNSFNFINKFGTIEYELNGQKKTHTIALKQVKPQKVNTGNDLYIEVLKEVKSATKITFVFKIRNQEYRYQVK